MAALTTHLLTVAEVIAETPDARSIVFDAQLDYRPGQFLTLRVPSDECGSVARCYSLSSSPHTGDRPQVTVKRTADGYASNWVCDNVAPGDTIEVLAPSGVFGPKHYDHDLLLFAGGSGITPIMSIIKSALDQGHREVALVYANRDPRSVIFADRLAELAAAHPGRLTVAHWLESERGIPALADLVDLARPHADHDVYTCGPQPFMTAVTEALTELGVPRERRHMERFVSLAANPFERLEQAAAKAAAKAAAEAKPLETAVVTVQLDGATHTVDWPVGDVLLDVLLDAGIEAPYSCQAASCGSCVYKLVSGDVRMDADDPLSEEEKADGHRLACQSHPLTEKVEIAYE
ncbi:Phenylacetate-CoA oxygenase/reductase, PaaK subunit [Actinokineospora spheciospongiae]|uniref:Phenylacetate-CoA oxygenase/reductase, PaaK subunit n=1 Tax=Actinokineospora spheciospongiae TaxID=909613 RepID=W7IXD3_9PSEU|nr:ferredoxin--NADP reductase [Actinokineospora spheciospongiae]EWC61497.1 Phenylacetate-CoA oxygenase/reductase, PaaK subunit [Actinokineospora spheciospongiae]